MTASTVIYSIAVSAPITPSEPLPPLPVIPRGSPAAAVAFYDPCLGAVVVATHSQERRVGQVVDVTLQIVQ